jgi:protein TonB
MKYLIACMALFAAALTGLAAQPVLKPVQNKFTFTGEFFKTAELDQMPEGRKLPGPRYPLAWSQARVNGEVQMAFIINAQGYTEQVQVVTATDEAFGDAAKEAVAKWRFKPGRKNGKPVAVAMVQKVEFKLEN